MVCSQGEHALFLLASPLPRVLQISPLDQLVAQPVGIIVVARPWLQTLHWLLEATQPDALLPKSALLISQIDEVYRLMALAPV